MKKVFIVFVSLFFVACVPMYNNHTNSHNSSTQEDNSAGWTKPVDPRSIVGSSYNDEHGRHHTTIAAFPQQATKFVIEQIVDQFTNETIVRVYPLDINSQSTDFHASLVGQSILIRIDFPLRDQWRYLRCNSTDVLRNGEVVQLNNFSHDGDVVRGGVLERVQFVINNVFIDELQMRVCNDILPVPSEFISALNALIELGLQDVQN